MALIENICMFYIKTFYLGCSTLLRFIFYFFIYTYSAVEMSYIFYFSIYCNDLKFIHKTANKGGDIFFSKNNYMNEWVAVIQNKKKTNFVAIKKYDFVSLFYMREQQFPMIFSTTWVFRFIAFQWEEQILRSNENRKIY